MFDAHGVDGDMWCVNSIYTQFAACCARLNIFNYPEIDKYDTLLYLDTDTLITNPLEPVFDIELEDKLYGSQVTDATIDHWGNGKTLFLENKIDIALDSPQILSTCALLFKNCDKIKSLFSDILAHIAERVPGDYDLNGSFDQDFISYQCHIQDCYDNTHLTKFLRNCKLEPDSDMILNHFCSLFEDTCGLPVGKLELMQLYLTRSGMEGYARDIIHIGANDGRAYHETESFYLFDNVATGDRCIFIEPVPYLFKQLVDNYNEKYPGNNFTFINKAVSNQIGEVEMTIASEENDFDKLPLWATMVGSIDPDHIEKHTPPDMDLITEKITVPTTTINEIVTDAGMTKIDLLQVDAEGHDFAILMGYDFSIKPARIAFEHHHLKAGNLAVLLTRLQMMGYKQIGFTELDIVLELSK
jgi:FkbM family methyltransferase